MTLSGRDFPVWVCVQSIWNTCVGSVCVCAWRIFVAFSSCVVRDGVHKTHSRPAMMRVKVNSRTNTTVLRFHLARCRVNWSWQWQADHQAHTSCV
mmetsp:Transcript_14241/g.33915  ORF Transcript_14241/g.33915 Transcript_14241/m.33915 type:complete len:95 (+) Transcript_14241:101-385(+)